MALGLFRRLVGNRKDIEVDAAGVHAVRGQPPSMHAIEVCGNAASISAASAASRSPPLWSSARRTFSRMTGSHLETIHLLLPAGARRRCFCSANSRNPAPPSGAICPTRSGWVTTFTTIARDAIEKALPSVLTFVEQTELALPRNAGGPDAPAFSKGSMAQETEHNTGGAGASALLVRRRTFARSIRRSSPRSKRRKTAAREHRADRLGELHQPRRDGSAGLLPHEQVCRRLSRETLVRRLRECRRRRATRHRSRAASFSAATTSTSSRTAARRPTWPSTFAVLKPGDRILDDEPRPRRPSHPRPSGEFLRQILRSHRTTA